MGPKVSIPRVRGVENTDSLDGNFQMKFCKFGSYATNRPRGLFCGPSSDHSQMRVEECEKRRFKYSKDVNFRNIAF